MSKVSDKKKANAGFPKRDKEFAKKSFGQNFLVDETVIGKIVAALEPKFDEIILEIGPGRGALTEKIVESGATVIAVEIEREMIRVLKEKFSANKNFILIENDALKIDFRKLREKFSDSKIKLVANLPYYISTAILQKLSEHRTEFSELILMFQREVVERLTADAGNSERGYLTVLTQTYFEIEKLFDVAPNSFRPAPKVQSAVVRLVPHAHSGIQDEQKFRNLISQAFRQKRKTLRNNLKNFHLHGSSQINDWEIILQSAGVSPERRAETLTIDEWKRLSGKTF